MLDSSPVAPPPKAVEPVRLHPGRIIPGTRYRLLHWIGEGGMGVVYEAEHIEIGRRVAVKILGAEHSRNPDALASFRDEARASAKIGAANIIEVYDFVTLPDGRLLTAMELLRGTDLSIVQEEPLEPGRAIGILRQLCQGLAAAHDAGIVHGDVKPENLFLITREGRADFVKILDFGVATMLGQGSDRTRRVGTAAYVSPEIVLDLPRGTKVDMYAAGCTAYELLTGRPPFEAEDLEALLRMHVSDAPTPIRDINPEIPKALAAVVMRMLSKNPEDRYADMRDVEAALCEAQIAAKLESSWDDLPIPEVDPQRRDAILRGMPESYLRGRPKRRVGLIVGAVAIAATLMASVATWGFMQSDDAPTAGSVVALMKDDARAAAARAYYVYPPKSNPEAATAYTKILELESSGEDGASEVAAQLRTQFSDTLTRLGDDLWEREGGRSFALDYYMQALIFEPENGRARERSQYTPGQLAGLTQRAAEKDFSESELVAVEPLAALALPDADDRASKLEQIAEEADVARPASTRAELSMLIGSLQTESPRSKSLGDSAPSVDAAEDSQEGPPAAGQTSEGAVERQTEPVDEDELEEGTFAGRDGTGPLSQTDTLRSVKDLVRRAKDASRRGAPREAEQLYNQVLAKDSGNVTALRGLGKLAFDQGDYSKALSYRKRAVRRSPRSARAQLELGDAYFKVLRYDDSLRHYEKARALGASEAERRVAKVEAKLGR